MGPARVETKRTLRVLLCKIEEIHSRLRRMTDEVNHLLAELAGDEFETGPNPLLFEEVQIDIDEPRAEEIASASPQEADVVAER